MNEWMKKKNLNKKKIRNSNKQKKTFKNHLKKREKSDRWMNGSIQAIHTKRQQQQVLCPFASNFSQISTLVVLENFFFLDRQKKLQIKF